ncbi:hypothetical protein P9Z56_02230 [Bacillus cereus]|nr:hypothetical protein [Bacillus cereus]MEC2742191.1 hypothetical protein [Bacillus cereus]MEC2753354.1 hypothetical protein [Bacillus cereus]MEC2825061.1 hypothetical protein [Bacillus cereus]
MKNGTFAIGDTVTVRSPLFSANVNVIGEKNIVMLIYWIFFQIQ